MRLYVTGTDDRQRTGVYRLIVAPGADPAMLEEMGKAGMPSEWFAEEDETTDAGQTVKVTKAVNFRIEFINGVADNVPASVAKYAVKRKLARLTSLIIPAGAVA